MAILIFDIQPILRRLVSEYGKLLKLWLGSELNVIVADPEYLEAILKSSSTLQKGPSYKYMWPFIGLGLLSGSGSLWKRQRKAISPCFHSKVIENHFETFHKYTGKLTNELSHFANGKSFNVFHIIADHTHTIVCETLLGVELDEEGYKRSEFIHSIHNAYSLIFLRMSNWWYQFELIYKYSNYFKIHKHVIEMTVNFCSYVYDRKMRDGQFIRAKEIALDSILDQSDNIEQFNGNVSTLQTASQESISTICSFTLMMLGIHKKVQNKLLSELELVFQNVNKSISYNDLNSLVYLEMVIKEVLRLFPIGSLITRSLPSDFKLTEKLIVPSGTTIAIPIYVIHRDPDVWGDPQTFRPERFLPEESAQRHPFSFLPFSHGPMNCVGQKYAMVLMKLIIAEILRKYEVHSIYADLDQVELMTDISIRPVNGYIISLKPK